MFKNIKDYFQNNASLEIDAHEKANQRDLLVACMALLVSMAHADSDFETSELNSIATEMFAEFGVSEHESAELLEIAEFLIKDGSQIDSFLKIVNEKLDTQQKELLLSMLWRVIIADGQAEKLEADGAAAIRVKLGMTMEQAVRARQMAEMKKALIENFNKLHKSSQGS